METGDRSGSCLDDKIAMINLYCFLVDGVGWRDKSVMGCCVDVGLVKGAALVEGIERMNTRIIDSSD